MSLLQHHGTTVKSDKLFTSEDVEMQQPPKQRRSAVVDNPRVTALECLFGLPREHVAMWPGAMAYCQYLEKCFAPLLTEDYATVWSVIRTRKPKVQAECWQWFMAVTSAIQSLKSEDSSVEDIWDKMRPSTSEDNSTHPTAFEKITCLIAIFAVLCWGTMALQPRLNWDGFKDSPCLMVEQQRPNQPGLKIELVRRPLPALFRLFRRTMLTSRWRTPIGSTGTDSSTALYVSSLNYASLNMIGKINVVWVDSISSHLDFNSANRQLSIFKFPSFCALSTSDDCRAAPVFVG
jgi:hypothetical protein